MIPTTGPLCCKYNSRDKDRVKKEWKLEEGRENKKRKGITKSQKK